MKFAGMQQVSLQDYPSLLSTIVWTQGCNRKCWWCHNPGMNGKLSFGRKISEDKVIDYIQTKNLNGRWIEALVICGGEPTIQKGLEKFLKRVKKEIPYLRVKIDTNGTNPVVLKRLIYLNLLDYIAMDVKVEEFSNPDYLESIHIVSEFMKNRDGEFRWTLHPESMRYKNTIINLFRGAKKFYLQKFSRRVKLFKDLGVKEYKVKQLEKLYSQIKSKFEKCMKRW